MTDQQIKVMFFKEILRLLRILFTEENAIDWQRAYEVAVEEMPELKNYKPELV